MILYPVLLCHSNNRQIPFLWGTFECAESKLIIRRVRGDLIKLYKIIHGYYRIVFINGIPYWIFGYSSRRNVFALTRESVRNCAPRHMFFLSRIVNTCNKLQKKIVTAANVNIFKAQFDECLNSNCIRPSALHCIYAQFIFTTNTTFLIHY